MSHLQLHTTICHRAQMMLAIYGLEAAPEALLRADAAVKYNNHLTAEFWFKVANAINTEGNEAYLCVKAINPAPISSPSFRVQSNAADS